MRKTIAVLLAFLASAYSIQLSAQEAKTTQQIEQAKKDSIERERPVNTGYFTLGVSGSIMSLYSDLNVRNNISTLNSFRINPGVHIEKRLGRHFSLGADYLFGKVSQNERDANNKLNFETSFSQVGGNVMFHFDTKAKHVFSPFFGLGVHFINFDVKSDLKDKDGKEYHYWDDNTIRDLPQRDSLNIVISYPSSQSFETLERDFTYESEVNESFDKTRQLNFENSALVFPITVGAKFKLAEFFDVRIAATYAVTQTDFIDGFYNDQNDNFINTSISAHYTFGKKFVSDKEKKFKGVDFNKMASSDADGDGVGDIMDECPNTPANIKVGVNGCPLDDDNDGVANYLDKEPNSVAGATVNRDGITLTDQELEKLYQVREQVYMEKVEKFYEAPSDSTLKALGLESADDDPDMRKVSDNKVDNPNSFEAIKSKIQEKANSGKVLMLPIPETGRFADENGDGKLQPTELVLAINSYLDGLADISVTDLMDLIEYFFEQ